MFNFGTGLSFEDGKDTLLELVAWDPFNYSHLFGAPEVVGDELDRRFNVVRLGPSSCSKGRRNFVSLSTDFIDSLHRKAEDPDYLEHNRKVLDSAFDEFWGKVGSVAGAVLWPAPFTMLPLKTYVPKRVSLDLNEAQNEYFDYVGEDPDTKRLVEEWNERVISDWDRSVSPIAFSTNRCSVFYSLMHRGRETGALGGGVVSYVIDPASFFTPFFKKHGIPSTQLYFADDTRGTRDFVKFPIAQLQHVVYDRRFFDPARYDLRPEDRKDLLFAGGVFYTKGTRTETWHNMLEGVRGEDNDYFIPLTKNVVRKRNVSAESETRDSFGDLVDSVKGHPSWRGFRDPIDASKVIGRYKYSVVLRCVSQEDSLNFRPARCAHRWTLPLVDREYDPEGLSIPLEIQEEIGISCSEELEDRISFFNSNEGRRMELVRELRDVFRIGVWNDADKRDSEIADAADFVERAARTGGDVSA